MPKLIKRVGTVYREITSRMAGKLIKEHHYSRRAPRAPALCYGVTQGSKLLACCTFGLPTCNWPIDVWELSRLVRVPDFDEPLTKLISKALGKIRQSKAMDLIVSFADAEEDHHGGVYQACSWIYDGMRGARLDGFNIDGKFMPARTLNSVYGTSAEENVREMFKESEVELHYDLGKHCYWKALTKDGMKKAVAFGLRSAHYPKPLVRNADGVGYKPDGHLRKGKIDLPRPDQLVFPTERIEIGNKL